MGAARGNLDCLAPQSRGLAGQVCAHSLGLFRDRPPSQPGRDGLHRGRGREDEATAPPTIWTARVRTWTRCSSSRRRPTGSGFEIPGLPSWCGTGEHNADENDRPARSACSTGSSMPGPSTQPQNDNRLPRRIAADLGSHAGCPRTAQGNRSPCRDGRGSDRRQRPRHAADNRGVPAERGSGPQSRPRIGRSWKGSSPITWASAT